MRYLIDKLHNLSNRPDPLSSRGTVDTTVSIRGSDTRSFRVFAAALVCVSVGATCIENGLHILMLLLLPLMVVALFRRDYARPYLWSERATLVLFSVYIVVFCAALVVTHGALTLPLFMVYFTFGILFVRVMLPLTDRNVAQVIALTVGLILINCILTNHILFGAILPVYLFLLMGTLLLFHLARSRVRAHESTEPPSGNGFFQTWYGKLFVYSVMVLAFTSVAFVFVPRPFLSIPGLTAAMAEAGGIARLQQRISYRDMAGMAGRNRIAFKVVVEYGKLPEDPYWRGRVLEKFDGREWSEGSAPRGMGRLIKWSPTETLDFQFVPFKLQSRVVYVTGLPVEVSGRMDRPLLITANGEALVDSPLLLSDSYSVSTVSRPVPVSRTRPPSVDLTGVTERVRTLAEQWTARLSSPRDKASTIASRLRRTYTYRLQPPATPEGVNPVEHFLFVSRVGNCEHFAGALCLMLRAVGIPARIVEGFAGVEKTDLPDEYLVRFGRAHAWVEAVLDGETWTELDASPAVGAEISHSRLWRWIVDFYDKTEQRWVKKVVYFDRADQVTILNSLKQLVKWRVSLGGLLSSRGAPYVQAGLVAAGMLIVVAVVLTVARLRRKRDLSDVYRGTMRKLARAGVLSAVHPWHEQNKEEIVRKAPGSRAAMARFMDVYLRARFGTDNSVSMRDVERAVRDLVRSVSSPSK